MTFDPDARLSSGMQAGEAVERAARWWDTRGRWLVRAERNQAKRKKIVATGRGPGLTIEGETIEVIPSGILAARPWDQLDRNEQKRVVELWHHWHVVVPDLDPESYRHNPEADQHHRLDPEARYGRRPLQKAEVVCNGLHAEVVSVVVLGVTMDQINRELRALGWEPGEDADYCPECVEAREWARNVRVQ